VKVLVAGWFSFEQMGATAGDLLARDVVCRWLNSAGIHADVALAPPFTGGVDWRSVDPRCYSAAIFVCGPFGDGEPVTQFLRHFAGCRLIGMDLTMLQPLEEWNPFDLLLERDSSKTARPDLALLSPTSKAPIAGVVLIHPQPEYGRDDRYQAANQALQRLIRMREMAAVPIDTRLDENQTGLRTPAEVDSLMGRMDVILTTRLHGLVLAIKNGVPAVVIDPVAGGAKVQRQAKVLEWPIIFTTDSLSDDKLQEAFDYCLTDEARVVARRCRAQAVTYLETVHSEFHAELSRMRLDASR
jgi:hypothetical protein